MALRNAFEDLALDTTVQEASNHLADIKARADVLLSEATYAAHQATVEALLDAIQDNQIAQAVQATVTNPPDLSLLATAAKQDALFGKDFATQATLLALKNRNDLLGTEATLATLATEATLTARIPAGLTVTANQLVIRGGGVPGTDATAGAGYLPMGTVIFNGATWDRLRGWIAANNTSGTGVAAAGLLAYDYANLVARAPAMAARDAETATVVFGAGGMVFNGTTWDRLRSYGALSGSGSSVGALGSIPLYFTGAAWGAPWFAGADGLAGTSLAGSGNMRYNGTSFDRERGNVDGTSHASAARTTTTSSPDIVNYNGDGVIVILRISAIGTAPSLVVTIEGKDPVSGVYFALNANPAAAAAVGTFVYEVGEGASGAAGGGVTQRTAGQLPRVFRVTVTHGNANSVTYSVGYSVISA